MMDLKSDLNPTQQQQQPSPAPRLLPKASSILSTVGLLFLTVCSILAAYRTRSDPWTFTFVVSSYTILMLLYWCIHMFDKLPAVGAGEKKQRLKLVIWGLATTLNISFVGKVSELMPWGVCVFFWFLAVCIAVAGFVALLIYRDPNINNFDQNLKISSSKKACSNKVSPEYGF